MKKIKTVLVSLLTMLLVSTTTSFAVMIPGYGGVINFLYINGSQNTTMNVARGNVATIKNVATFGAGCFAEMYLYVPFSFEKPYSMSTTVTLCAKAKITSSAYVTAVALNHSQGFDGNLVIDSYVKHLVKIADY